MIGHEGHRHKEVSLLGVFEWGSMTVEVPPLYSFSPADRKIKEKKVLPGLRGQQA